MSAARNLLLLVATAAALAAVVGLGLSGGSFAEGTAPTTRSSSPSTGAAAVMPVGPAESAHEPTRRPSPNAAPSSQADAAQTDAPPAQNTVRSPEGAVPDRAPSPQADRGVARPTGAVPGNAERPLDPARPPAPRARPSPERADSALRPDLGEDPAALADADRGQEPADAAPELAPPTTGVVRGVVRDEAGRPLAGVLVSLGPAGSASGATTASARSDAAGGFRLEAPPGTWALTAFGGRAHAVHSAPFALVVGQELVVPLPPLPTTRWRVALVAPDGAALPNASGRLRFADGLELPGALRDGALELSLGDAPEPALPAEAELVVDPGHERLRRWVGRVEVTANPLLASVRFVPCPVLELTLELAADEPSAALRVETLQDEPLATRTGVGLRPVADAEPDALLWSTGAIVSSEPQEDEGAWPVRREVRVRVGLDVALPTTVRIRLEPRRARTHGDPVVTPTPRVLELVLDAPLVEARLPLLD